MFLPMQGFLHAHSARFPEFYRPVLKLSEQCDLVELGEWSEYGDRSEQGGLSER